MALLKNREVPFSPPVISEDEIQAVVEVLRSGWIGTGPRVQEFEKKLKEYIGASNVVALSSCTAALHLSLLTLGVQPGDEVITTPMTFAATANVIVHVGATPVFADIDRESWNIDPAEVKKKITKRTKVVMPVHLGGLPCDMDALAQVTRGTNVRIVEDAAHALGAKYGGKMLGDSDNLVCFSFYPTKNITSIEGGLVSTSDPAIAESMRVLRLAGQSSDAWERHTSGKVKSYQVTKAGFKYNMTDVQAALGTKQLEKIGAFLKTRENAAKVYLEELKGEKGITLPLENPKNGKRVWHLFSIILKTETIGMTREQVMEKLSRAGIGTGIHYEAVHMHPYYREAYKIKPGALPVAEYISSRILSLPMSAALTEDQASYVATTLKSILKRNN